MTVSESIVEIATQRGRCAPLFRPQRRKIPGLILFSEIFPTHGAD